MVNQTEMHLSTSHSSLAKEVMHLNHMALNHHANRTTVRIVKTYAQGKGTAKMLSRLVAARLEITKKIDRFQQEK
jgi:hypothetical protein